MKYTGISYIESLVTMQILGDEAADGMKIIREDRILPDMLGGIPGKKSTHNYLYNLSMKSKKQNAVKGRCSYMG